MSPSFRYTIMRLGIFVGCFLVMWGVVRSGVMPSAVADANPFWVVLAALAVSAPLSLVLLSKQREAMAAQVAARVDRAMERLAANQSQEDEAVRWDEARSEAAAAADTAVAAGAGDAADAAEETGPAEETDAAEETGTAGAPDDAADQPADQDAPRATSQTEQAQQAQQAQQVREEDGAKDSVGA